MAVLIIAWRCMAQSPTLITTRFIFPRGKTRSPITNSHYSLLYEGGQSDGVQNEGDCRFSGRLIRMRSLLIHSSYRKRVNRATIRIRQSRDRFVNQMIRRRFVNHDGIGGLQREGTIVGRSPVYRASARLYTRESIPKLAI